MTNIQRLLKIPTVLLGTALLATSCAGTVGSAGSAGAQGPAGPQGPQGLTGAIGSTGPQGPVGPAGPQGLSGAQGPRGFSGSDGSQGSNGLSAYQMYIADYPGYAAASPGLGLNATQWVKDLASNALYPTITFDYTNGTNLVDTAAMQTAITEPANFRAFKGQTYAQYPLADLFVTLTGTPSGAAFSYQFYTVNDRTTGLITDSYVFGSHTTIFVKATRIAISSIVVENITSASNLTASAATIGGEAGFAVTVPLNSTGFKRYLATTSAAVRATTYSYVHPTLITDEYLVNWLVKLPGTQTTFSNAYLTPTSNPLTSFGVWQVGGSANNDRLTFETPRVITVYNRIIFSDDTFRTVPLKITVPAEVLNDVATLGAVGTSVSSATTATATVAIVSGKVIITPVAPGTSAITVTPASGSAATFTVTVSATGDLTIGTITKSA